MALIVKTPIYDGYGITRSGRVYSYKRKKRKRLKPHRHKSGYLYLMLRVNGIDRTVGVHTLLLLTFKGLPKKGQVCRHLDGNPNNNSLTNIKWGTSKQNRADALKHGTAWLGGNNQPRALNNSYIKRFIKLRKKGLRLKDIAKKWGIAFVTLFHYKKKWIKQGALKQDPKPTFKINQGSKHGMSKLTEQDVRDMRTMYATGDYYIKDIAKHYKMNGGQVGEIIKRRSWKHVS